MNNSPFLAALLLALPLAAAAQTTTPAPTKPGTTVTKTATGEQQVTETVEELDPATGKVIRRTTRTTTVPAGTAIPSTTTSPSTSPSTTSYPTEASSGAMATDAQVTAFLRTKTTVSTLTAPALLNAYSRFMERVHASRQGWKAADWANAAAVLSSLNARYEQLRSSFSFDDKVNIRTQQAEFQTLRTARQLSDQVSDKL